MKATSCVSPALISEVSARRASCAASPCPLYAGCVTTNVTNGCSRQRRSKSAETGAPAVQAIAFPQADSVVNDYPIALVDGTTNPAAAQAFVDEVLSPACRQVLAAAGFDPAG